MVFDFVSCIIVVVVVVVVVLLLVLLVLLLVLLLVVKVMLFIYHITKVRNKNISQMKKYDSNGMKIGEKIENSIRKDVMKKKKVRKISVKILQNTTKYYKILQKIEKKNNCN